MKITRLCVNRKILTYDRGSYAWGGGNVLTESISTIVVVDSDAGPSGCMPQARSGLGDDPNFDYNGDPVAVYT